MQHGSRSWSVALAVLLLTTACSGGVAQDDFDAALAEVSTLEGRLSAAQAESEQLADELGLLRSDLDKATSGASQAAEDAQASQTETEAELLAAEAAVTELEAKLSTADQEIASLATDLEDARENVAALMLAYDAEIQAAKADFQQGAKPLACEAGREEARAGRSRSFSLGLLELDQPAGTDTFEIDELLDVEALGAEFDRCFADEAAIIAAAIQAAAAALQREAKPLACDAGREVARAGDSRAFSLGLLDLKAPEGTPSFDMGEHLDLEALEAEFDRCFADEAATIAEEEQRERLTSPKSDGFYVVGEEIMPGVWRSTGAGDGCYWERLSGLSGEFGDIIANHFGNAGVTVRIRSSDAAFSSDRCGPWEYQGS